MSTLTSGSLCLTASQCPTSRAQDSRSQQPSRLSSWPPATLPGDGTHLQLLHFSLLELHPGLHLSGLPGLLLSLPLLLLPRLLPQPLYTGRSKRLRQSWLDYPGAGQGVWPRPAHRSSCSRWFSAWFQAISSRCSAMSCRALRSASTPDRASYIFLRTSDTNSILGGDARKVGTLFARPPTPTHPLSGQLPLRHTHLRARTVWR